MSSPEKIAALHKRLEALPETVSPRERTKTLVELAIECARAGLPREGLDAVKEAARLAQINGFDMEQAEAMSAASMCHYFRGDFLMAIVCGLDAYQGFAARNDLAQMGHALTPIAASCEEIEAPDLAVEALEGCLTIAGRLTDHFLKARTHNTLGVVLGDIGRFDDAERHFHAARAILEATQDGVHLPKVIANLGHLNRKRADAAIARGDSEAVAPLLRKGIELLQLGLNAAEEDANAYETADKMGTLGELYFLLGEYTIARDRVQRARDLGQTLKHHHIVIETTITLARIEMAENKLVEAERQFRAALDLARQAENKPLQLQVYRRLAECYQHMGRSIDAAAQTALAHELGSSIDQTNKEAQREARVLWRRYFSQHPLIGAEN
jgi:tetratricopeptide (TPR) repeat protein